MVGLKPCNVWKPRNMVEMRSPRIKSQRMYQFWVYKEKAGNDIREMGHGQGMEREGVLRRKELLTTQVKSHTYCQILLHNWLPWLQYYIP